MEREKRLYTETERFILRELNESDVDGMFALDSDPEVLRYLVMDPVQNKQQALETINMVRQQYVSNGIGRWAVIDKETSEFLGWAGLKFVQENTNGHISFYDVGYRLLKKHWGKGVATECTIAALDYGFHVLKIETIYAAAHIDNKGSNNVLKKVGMKFIETFEYKGTVQNWYKMNKEEWK